MREAPRWVDARGRLCIRLPNGMVLRYTEDDLAYLIVETVGDRRLQDASTTSFELRVETLRRLAGEERWTRALETLGSLPTL